jgi:hypothetical protein
VTAPRALNPNESSSTHDRGHHFVVSRDAGHESVTTTDRYYGHNDRNASESAAQIIAGRLPRVRANMLSVAT